MGSIFTYRNIYEAYLDCARKKSNKNTHIEFFSNLEENLYNLFEDLKSRKYKIGKSMCFVVKDPCIREVFAGNFRDRIVHHLLINQIEFYFERFFIYDSFSCRKNKGIHLGVKRLQNRIKSLERKSCQIPYYIKLDIDSFFMSVDKDVLYSILEKYLQKIKKRYAKSELWIDEILYLCRVIIYNNPTISYEKRGDLSLFNKVPKGKSLFHIPENKGLPIGNLTSQFFANVYLNELDQFVKRKLEARYYYRYVDDFVILDKNKAKLGEILKTIDGFLQEMLKLKINNKKTKLQRCDRGIDFAGYIVRSKYLLVRNRTAKKAKNKIWQFMQKKDFKYDRLKEINASLNSYFGCFKHAKAYRLKNQIINCLLLFLLCMGAYCLYAQEIIYTAVADSQPLPIVKNLSEGIQKVFPEPKMRYIDFKHKEGKEILKRFEISEIPFIFFDKELKENDEKYFMLMV